MSNLVEVPLARVPREQLQRLLEEFASRDGTDYGARETVLEARVHQLEAQLRTGKAQLLFDGDSEQWDILSREEATRLLNSESQA